MPVSWTAQRKLVTFITRPKPGSLPSKYVITAAALLKDVLGYAHTTKEAKHIIHEEEVLVNGKRITTVKFPIGIFDVVEIKKTKDKFTILFDKLAKVKRIDIKESTLFLKVKNKTVGAKKKLQINFTNGFNTLVDEKTFQTAKVNDTVMFDYEKKKIEKVITLKEGAFVYIFDGKFVGNFGEVKEFVNYNGLTRDVVKVQIGDEIHTTAKDYCFVVGAKKEDIKRFN